MRTDCCIAGRTFTATTPPLFWAGVCLGICCLIRHPVLGQEGLLRWKFQPDQALQLRLQQQSGSETRGVGVQTLRTQLETSMEITWQVQAVDAEGTAQIKQKIGRLQLRMVVPGSEPLELDTAGGKSVPPALRPMAADVLRLLELPIMIRVSARGELLGATPPEAAPALTNLPDPMRGLLNEEGLTRILNQTTVVLPEGPVQVGQTWTTRATVPSPLGNLAVQNRYTYRGVGNEAGRQLDRIEVVSQATLAEAQSQTMLLQRQETRGEMLFDRAAGHLARTSLTQKLTSRSQLGNVPITGSIDGRISLELEAVK